MARDHYFSEQFWEAFSVKGERPAKQLAGKMKCVNCGNEIPNGSKFCTVCGAKQPEIPNVGPDFVEQTGSMSGFNTYDGNRRPAKKGGFKKAIKFIVLIGIVVAAAAVYFLFFYKTKINVTKHAEFEFNGYDGYGSVAVDLNLDEDKGYEKLQDEMEDLEDEISRASNRGTTVDSDVSKEYDALAEFQYELGCHIEKDGKEIENGSLSNGDEITYVCEVSDSVARKAARYKFEYTGLEKDITVEGLDETETVDIFEGVTVDWQYDGDDVEPVVTAPDDNPVIANGYSFYIEDYDDTGSVTVEAGVTEEELLNIGIGPKDGVTKVYDIGAAPVVVRSVTDSAVQTAAQKVTDPWIQADIAACNDKLTVGDTNEDLKLSGFLSIENSYGIMEVTYQVTAGGNSYERTYDVVVLKYSDGTYTAYNVYNYKPGNSACKVSSYSSTWYD